MNVYIAQGSMHGDGTTILGAFSTREVADSYIARYRELSASGYRKYHVYFVEAFALNAPVVAVEGTP